MKKIISILLILIVAMSALAACSKTEPEDGSVSITLPPMESKEEVVSEAEPMPLPNREAGAVDPNTGLYMNPFTGVFDIEEENYGNRPCGLMINNIREALPQWGISAPDVCYEFLVEGGITRILALFADVNDIPKMGPIRSARTYYVSTVHSYDALYVHFGGSNSGIRLLKNLNVDDIDGARDGACTQDLERKQIRAIEHTYYTTSEKIMEITKKRGYRTERKNKDYVAFSFTNEGEDITVNGECKPATNIDVVFSPYTNSNFAYNESDGLYYKSEYGNPQVDANNDKQVAVKNVIVIGDSHAIEPENKKCQILGQKAGDGYYFSNGKVIAIKWTKGSHDTPYAYTLTDGTPLKINPGKTWVSVVKQTQLNSGALMYN